MSRPLSVADYERLATELLDETALGYFAGGAGDERTLAENVEAFARVRLVPRVLRDVSQVSAAAAPLGLELSMPVMVAPVACQKLAHPEGELAMVRGAAAAGTAMCLSTLASATVEDVAAASAGAPLLYQVYVFRDRGLTRELIDRAVAAGCRALLLTVDFAVRGGRERELRNPWTPPGDLIPALGEALGRGSWDESLSVTDPSLDWAYLEELAASTDLPVLAKGVLAPDDAVLAAEHGAAGVVVSNHGGRQLDGVAPAIEALPAVAEAAEDRLEVWLDSGVRRGTHVLQALALGARAVLVGRAPVWGLTVDGEAGVQAVLELLREEIEIALALLGCTSPSEVGPDHVYRVGAP